MATGMVDSMMNDSRKAPGKAASGSWRGTTCPSAASCGCMLGSPVHATGCLSKPVETCNLSAAGFAWQIIIHKMVCVLSIGVVFVGNGMTEQLINRKASRVSENL